MKQQSDNDKIIALLKPINDSLSKLLTGIEKVRTGNDPDNILVIDLTTISNVSIRARLDAVYSMSVNAVKALFEVHTVYTDMQVCIKMAESFPWTEDAIKKSEHLNFVWMLFINLCYLFRLKLKQAYNVAQPVSDFSGTASKFDVAAELKVLDKEIGKYIRARGQHWHQWNVGHKWVRDFRMFELLHSAGSWPQGWPDIDHFFEAARDELATEIRDATAAIESNLVRLITATSKDITSAIDFFTATLPKFLSNSQASRTTAPT